MSNVSKQLVMRWIVLLFFVCLSWDAAHAQDYRFSAGVRTGYSSGLSFKYFNEPEVGLEAIMSFRNHGLQLTGFSGAAQAA